MKMSAGAEMILAWKSVFPLQTPPKELCPSGLPTKRAADPLPWTPIIFLVDISTSLKIASKRSKKNRRAYLQSIF
jgi:hypothetical protein